MIRHLFLFCLCAGALAASSQTPHVQSFVFPRSFVSRPSDARPDFFPGLSHVGAPFPGGQSTRDHLAWLKQQPRPRMMRVTAAQKASTVPDLIAGRCMEGNGYMGFVPNDNDLAVSNGGKIVSVINSNIYFYDTSGAALGNLSLDNFGLATGISTDSFDPKVRYDPRADRFVVVWLSGFTDTTSHTMIAFSQTNDPTGNWNAYELPGNPLNDSSWTDYPIIALTEKELFITVNLLIPDQPWQTAFKQSVVWQVNLGDGYRGDTLRTALWTNIGYNGTPIRNLCPVQGGSTTYGPNLYLLSNRNFAASNDSVFIAEITDTIGSPMAAMLVDMKRTNQPYGFPPDAHQRYTYFLNTNDARILGAFLENGKIQFVSNTVNPDTNLAAVYHGMISNVTGARTITGAVIKEDTIEFGYPNISYTGSGATDHSAIITFNHTSKTQNPGFSGVYSDNTFSHSPRRVLKEGLNFINVIAGNYERWGDYSGTQRKYDEPGKVWAAGTFGIQNRTYGTWITELLNPELYVARESEVKALRDMKVFPNPAPEFVTVAFTLPAGMNTVIALFDAEGRLIRNFIADKLGKGENLFTFSVAPLPEGLYFLKISGEGVSESRKIVVKR